MAGSDNFLGKDEIRTHFSTREGLYRVVAVPSEYARPSRYPLDGRGGNLPVRLSFVSVAPTNGGPWKHNDDHTPGCTFPEGLGYYNTAPVSDGGNPNIGPQNNDNSEYSQTTDRHVYGRGGPEPSPLFGQVTQAFNSPQDSDDIIGFNVGKDLFIYQFHGAQRVRQFLIRIINFTIMQ